MVQGDRMRGDASSCTRRFRLNIRNEFFTERLFKHWNRLSWEVVKSSSLGIFKICVACRAMVW